MAHDIRAELNFLPQSAQKVRLVLDTVRGMSANEALENLRFVNKRAGEPVLKLLKSAVANAEENFGVSRDDLFVAQIFANEAPTRKWRRFGARGRFKPILRRHRISPSSCASAGRKKGLKELWVAKYIRSVCVLGSISRGKGAGSQKARLIVNNFIRISPSASLLGGMSKGGAAMNSRANQLRKELPEMVLNGKAGISRVDVERFPGKVRIAIHTAKPGILIGRKGEGVKKIRAALEALVGKKIDLDVKEIESPDTDATLVARNVADQLERRIAYRRAMKRAIQQAMRQGAKGIKIMVGGRLGGAEMSRDVWLREGRVPLQTLRANIDFARTEALTTYGQIGVKVWIYRGRSCAGSGRESGNHRRCVR